MNRTIIAVAIASAGLAATASAGIEVVGSTGSGWATFPTVLNDYSNAARPFWDQRSMDSGNRNIGNFLRGNYTMPLPVGSATSPNITPVWWQGGVAPLVGGGGPMNADPKVHFITTGGADAIASTMMLEVAGYHDYNEIGWYNINDALGSETLHPIYTGGTDPVTNATFTPSGAWGLYIRSFQGYTKSGKGLLFFTESNRNRANGPDALSADDRKTQHFALFAPSLTPGNERYTIGVEDLALRSTGVECWGDYNDVVLTIQAVPAPGAMALLGLGGLIVARRRR